MAAATGPGIFRGWRVAPGGWFLAALVLALVGVPGRSLAHDLRVVSYNASMFRESGGELLEDVRRRTDGQLRQVARVIQHLQPDVLVLNEVDYDATGETLAAFQDNYLSVGQAGEAPVEFAHRFAAASNTGEHSGFDLDNRDGVVSEPGSEAYGNDAFGFGQFPGQYGMAVYSKFPFADGAARTFRRFLWRDLPGSEIPPGFYSAEELEVLRLSSKSHWDLTIVVGGQPVHLLVSHPTPPTFDGAEDRNGRRNHDEIRFWVDYLEPAGAAHLYDDAGRRGGLQDPARFLVMGDLNASRDQGDSLPGAVGQLLDHPRVAATPVPLNGRGTDHTAVFFGGIRLDYVLPSSEGWYLRGGGVLWPSSGAIAGALEAASDHRPVFLDLTLVPLVSEAVRDLEVSRSGDMLTLTWAAQPGVAYGIAFSEELGGWEIAPDASVSLNGGAPPVATAAAPLTGNRKFYRIESWFEDTAPASR